MARKSIHWLKNDGFLRRLRWHSLAKQMPKSQSVQVIKAQLPSLLSLFVLGSDKLRLRSSLRSHSWNIIRAVCRGMPASTVFCVMPVSWMQKALKRGDSMGMVYLWNSASILPVFKLIRTAGNSEKEKKLKIGNKQVRTLLSNLVDNRKLAF